MTTVFDCTSCTESDSCRSLLHSAVSNETIIRRQSDQLCCLLTIKELGSDETDNNELAASLTCSESVTMNRQVLNRHTLSLNL